MQYSKSKLQRQAGEPLHPRLRRILADRDSSALGVTVLSSDMGKLYVALAQAVERLR